MITWPILIVACWACFFMGFFCAAIMAAGKGAEWENDDSEGQGRR